LPSLQPYVHCTCDAPLRLGSGQECLQPQKHGVSFEEAKSVFADEHGRLLDDPDHSADEERFILLGMSATLRILVVCHCYRQANSTIRIISARKANRSEQRQYDSR
jgi:uncharacterized protein